MKKAIILNEKIFGEKMKPLQKIIISFILVIFWGILSITIKASDKTTRDLILSAMKDELKRNVEKLKLENLESPFFIQFTIRDGKTLEVNASLGSIVESQEQPFRNHTVRVLVGGYQNSDENYFDFASRYSQGSSSMNASMPIENDYDGIRRALWITTDNTYKKAAEQIERKKAALARQSLSPELASLGDFSKSTPVKYFEAENNLSFDKSKWEKIAKEISSSFRKYPEIFNSTVRLYFYNADEFIINNEGTEVIKPLNLCCLQINAYTQADDGEELNDHILLYSEKPDELPEKEKLLEEIQLLAERLTSLRHAPVFDESYSGPVMFQGQAAAEFFVQRLFRSSNGLLAVKKPLVSDPSALNYINQLYSETLESRLEKRIISKDITIKTTPRLKEFNGVNLIGKYEVDEEGVKPPEESIIVQNGILKTMLGNRTPTPGNKISNGHQLPLIGPWQLRSSLGPGIINIESNNGITDEQMKNELIQLAKDEGLEYTLLVREIKPIVTGNNPSNDMMAMYFGTDSKKKMLEEPIYVYRVYVKDGREELIRSVEIDDPSISALKHIAGVSGKQFVYNNLMPTAINYSIWDMSGIPSTFIVPDALLLEELEVRKEKRDYTPQLPIVSSPLKTN